MNSLPDAILDRKMEGQNLSADTLREHLASNAPTLAVFLRHLG